MVPTLAMICLIMREKHHVWCERLIQVQHLVNEVVIYVIAMLLNLFIVYEISYEYKKIIGYAYLGLIVF